MTRVLMTADASGGVWTYALELARALAEFDVQITLATMGPRPSDDQAVDACSIPRLELVVSDYALEWRLDDGLPPWNDLYAAGAWLLTLERRFCPHIVHLNGYAHGALPFESPTIVVAHSCVSSWAEATSGNIPPLTLASYGRLVRAGLNMANVVVAPTRAMLAALERHHGALRRTAVIPNGRGSDDFPRTAKEPLIATGGRLWDRAKNIDAVRAVAGDLRWPVVIAGNERSDAPLAPQRQILELLARASIFVLPARYEPFGLLPLEAALCGCALVLGDIASLREVWGDAAVYVNPDDRGALRRELETLIANPVELHAKAAAAQSRAAAYSPRAMASRYFEMYQTLVRSRQCA